jgi:tetratricopeptide (TPR) repeat protein
VDYFDGLETMRRGRFPEAAAAFSSALQRQGDDPKLILARGIALALAERFSPALEDFARYGSLRGPGREAKLWTYAVEIMSGVSTQANAPRAPRSLQGQMPAMSCEASTVAVPGHVIQGGQDYPTDYASFVIYDMARPYWEARCANRAPGTLRVALDRAGSWFAHRHLTRPELVPLQLTRAREYLASGQYPDALAQAGFARAARPGDPDVLYVIAESWRQLGRPATARREFTTVLTGRTDFVSAYLGRAQTAARMGDVTRARADLQIAAALDRSTTQKVQAAVEAELARQPAPGRPEDLLTELERAARSDTPFDRLVDSAARVHIAASAQRLRYDEQYQDRLRTLEADVRAHLRDPGRLVALARYLAHEVYLRGESVEPRRALVPYRWQDSEAKELGRALAHLDAALALDPRHVRAMMQKAAVLARLNRDGEAEPLADRALALAPNDPEVLALYALYKGRRANELNAAAAALRAEQCSTSTHTESRYDGRWEITRRTCWPPSAADLERAKQLDAQAAELRQRSRAAMQRAIDATKGTYQGYLLQADAYLWARQGAQAVQALKQAIQLEPNNPQAQEELARLYERLGERDNATEQRIVVNRFFQTTAAPLLERAWDEIARTAWQGASQSLTRARGLDPVDARVPAYLGVTFQGMGRPDEAAAAFRVALALEEARIRLDEPAVAVDRMQPRDIQDFGLTLWLRQRLAAQLVARGQSAQALPLHRANTLTGRFRPGWPAVQMFSAMVPDPQTPQGVKPAPVNGATLVAASHMEAGRLFKAAGQPREASQEFAAAAALGPQPGSLRPRVGTGSGDSNFAGEAGRPSGEALIELAREQLELGDVARASQYLNAATQTPLTPEARRKVNELQMAIARKMR